MHISASKLKTFSECPQRYFYKYIDRAPEGKHPAALLGSAVHRTIEQLHTGALEQDEAVPAFVQDLRARSKDEQLYVPDKLYQDGMRMLDQYDATRRTPQLVEVEFKIPFPGVEDVEIHGFIDQLYDWGFVDLKTNKRRPLQGVLNNDYQFMLYAWAFKELSGEEPMHSIWHHLRDSTDIESFMDDGIEKVRTLILRVIEADRTGVYNKNIGSACAWCPFRVPCLGTDQ